VPRGVEHLLEHGVGKRLMTLEAELSDDAAHAAQLSKRGASDLLKNWQGEDGKDLPIVPSGQQVEWRYHLTGPRAYR
jgi:hypothetical protein